MNFVRWRLQADDCTASQCDRAENRVSHGPSAGVQYYSLKPVPCPGSARRASCRAGRRGEEIVTPLTPAQKQELEQRYELNKAHNKEIDVLNGLSDIHPLKESEKQLREDVIHEKGRNLARISELENVERTDP